MAYAEPVLPVLFAIFATFLLFVLLISIAAYIYQAIVLTTIAKKTKTKDEWLAWIPIAMIYLMTKIAKVSGWFTLLFFVPVINLIVYVWLWWKIAEARQKPGWMALLMIIPIANLVIMGIIAWKD